MNQAATSHYTFGDNQLAAARLERLAAAYAESSRAFLLRALPNRVERAVDLGCGLGLTTELLRDLTQAKQVVGYERSPQYLESARLRCPDLVFRGLDVQHPPYPDRNLDVIYSRFLLTHLNHPQKVIGACVAQLRTGGRLLLEEVAELDAPIAVLQRYYAMVDEMQAHYGQKLHIGQHLAEFASGIVGTLVTAQLTHLSLPSATMAQLHGMNIATWKNDPFMRAQHGTAELEALEADLRALAASNGTVADQAAVTCVMAQVVLEKL